jgi:hypothetical protein
VPEDRTALVGDGSVRFKKDSSKLPAVQTGLLLPAVQKVRE